MSRRVSSFRLLLLAAPLALTSCSQERPPPVVPPVTTAEPPPSASIAVSGILEGKATSSGTYQGHGVSSVSPELLQKYAPKPLPSDVSRRVQNMLDLRSPSGGRVSPDGRRVFFSWNVTGTTQVWRLDAAGGFPVQMTGGEDATRTAGVTPDGKTLLVSRDRKGEENPGLYSVPSGGGPLTEILHKPSVQVMLQHISDDSKKVLYRANDIKTDSYAIYEHDLATGKREVLFQEPGLWSVDDVWFGDKLLLAKSTGATWREYFEWDRKKKELTPLFGQGEKEEYDASYGTSPDELLVRTAKFGNFRRLYRTKLPKGALTETALAPITPERNANVDSFGLNRTRTRLFYSVNDGGFTRAFALSAKTFKEEKFPLPKGADHEVIVSSSPDGRYTMLSGEFSSSPAHLYVADWKTGKLTEWLSPSTPEVDTSTFAKASLESYPARDGTKIPMLVRRPKVCTAPCPVVVHFHGGPEGQSTPGFSPVAELFVQAGFVYVEPNVRGSEGYGKAWLRADDGPKRLSVVTDIEDASKFIRTAWAHDGKAPKVGIFGGSYGGYSVLMGMTYFAGAYDAGVSVVGISSLTSFLANTAPYRRALRISEYGDPEKDKNALEELSPVTHIRKLKAPLFLIQGATDPRVPVGEAIQMYGLVEKQGVDTGLILFPDEGHGAQKRENRVLQFGHAIAFFEKHLKR